MKSENRKTRRHQTRPYLARQDGSLRMQKCKVSSNQSSRACEILNLGFVVSLSLSLRLSFLYYFCSPVPEDASRTLFLGFSLDHATGRARLFPIAAAETLDQEGSFDSVLPCPCLTVTVKYHYSCLPQSVRTNIGERCRLRSFLAALLPRLSMFRVLAGRGSLLTKGETRLVGWKFVFPRFVVVVTVAKVRCTRLNYRFFFFL